MSMYPVDPIIALFTHHVPEVDYSREPLTSGVYGMFHGDLKLT